MNQFTLADRVRYALDRAMSRGTAVMLVWLAVLAVLIVVSLAIMFSLGGDALAGHIGWGPAILLALAALVCIFFISALIAVLTTLISSRLEELKRGHTTVVESGHTVILGWSPLVFSIISELAIANENQPESCIVVLADRPRSEMEWEIHEHVHTIRHTRVVCRSGQPIEIADLDIVSLPTSQSIIILAPDDHDPDASVIKSLLAVIKHPNRRPEPYHIVAELVDPASIEIAQLIGGQELVPVLTGELAARAIAQTCHQPGLSIVYDELLNFSGDEIYLKQEPQLVGKTFGEALLAYEDSLLIGLHIDGRGPKLNPPMDTPIRANDHIIAISADDDTIRLSGHTDWNIDQSAIHPHPPARPSPEHILLLGWNWRLPIVIDDLGHYVAPGSTVQILADCSDQEAQIAESCTYVPNLTVSFQRGHTDNRRVLERLPLAAIDHVILLSYSDAGNQSEADARTLTTLFHLRDLADRNGYTFSIISEVLDIHNWHLVHSNRPNDFAVTSELAGLVLAQIAQDRSMAAIIEDLFDPSGSEVYLKPATDYLQAGKPVNFYTVVEATRRYNEVALGYRRQAHTHDADRMHGIVLNPPKSTLITFQDGDQLIVLAEG